MPATRTRARPHSPPYYYDSSSSSESSVLTRQTPFPYTRISTHILFDYCRIVEDEETFNKLMATIKHRCSLVNQSRTIWHLWLTTRQLLQEVDRQRIKANCVFDRMKRMGLQQELFGSRWTWLPRRERSVTPWSSVFYSCKDQSSYQEAYNELTSLLSESPPPAGSRENPVIISDDDDDIESLLSHLNYSEAQSFSISIQILLHCQDCVDHRHQYYECPQYICDHYLHYTPMHRMSDCPNHWSWWLQF
jgi:hypothetical protein